MDETMASEQELWDFSLSNAILATYFFRTRYRPHGNQFPIQTVGYLLSCFSCANQCGWCWWEGGRHVYWKPPRLVSRNFFWLVLGFYLPLPTLRNPRCYSYQRPICEKLFKRKSKTFPLQSAWINWRSLEREELKRLRDSLKMVVVTYRRNLRYIIYGFNWGNSIRSHYVKYKQCYNSR